MSDKVEIICTCDGIRIADMGLSLVKGQRVQVPATVSTMSLDRQLARRVGGVSLRTIKGPTAVRPSQNTARRDTSRLRPLRESQIKEPPAPTEVEKVRALLEEQLSLQQAQMTTLLETIKTLDTVPATSASASIDLSALEGFIKSALSDLNLSQVPTSGLSSNATLATTVDSGPMFIPEGIVVEASADIETAEDSSGFSVDEATEALKAMKRAKKKK